MPGVAKPAKRWCVGHEGPGAVHSIDDGFAMRLQRFTISDATRRLVSVCSTNQSLDYRTFQRIEENPRVCARLAFACGPRERRRGRKSAKFRESSLRAISLCPTPCDRRRADSRVGAFRRRTFALLSATKSAESASHLAASERCVLRTRDQLERPSACAGDCLFGARPILHDG
jgi:hypothetical protein